MLVDALYSYVYVYEKERERERERERETVAMATRQRPRVAARGIPPGALLLPICHEIAIYIYIYIYILLIIATNLPMIHQYYCCY